MLGGGDEALSSQRLRDLPRIRLQGRVGVFEVVRITPRMASLIQSRASLPDMRTAAREQGMKLLLDSGWTSPRWNHQSGRSVDRCH